MTLEILSIVSSIVSLIIGTFAIWLSVTFYRMSDKSSNEIKSSSDQIDASVKRLEVLFEKLYSDTFSVVKDTVTDMREYIWKDTRSTGTQSASENIDRVKEELKEEIKSIVSKHSATEDELKRLNSVIDKAIEDNVIVATSNDAGYREEILEAISKLKERNRRPSIMLIAEYLKLDEVDIVDDIFDLRKDRIITWNESGSGGLRQDEEIILIDQG